MKSMLRFEWLFSAPTPIHQAVFQPVARIMQGKPFTVVPAFGAWDGKQELAWVLIEYRDLSEISPQGMAEAFNLYAESIGSAIASEFRQDAVLASWQHVNGSLVTS